jgi:hypothetical protein
MESISDPDRKAAPFPYEQERQTFIDTFRVLNQALGEGAFSGLNKKGTQMGYFSALHFEALTIGIQKHLPACSDKDKTWKSTLRSAVQELKKSTDFQKLTKGGGKNYAAALRQRIQAVETKVGECLK